MGRDVVLELLLGLVLGAAIGWFGYRLRVFSRDGILGVTLVSTAAFGAGGWVWGAVLLICLLGSSLCSHYGLGYKERLTERYGRNGRRGLVSVLAGAGWGTVLALLHLLAPRAIGIYAAYVGTLAAMTADTWATELGVLSARPPRLITSRRRVAAGTPGAVSTLGIVAALSGAWLAGFVGLLLSVLWSWFHNAPWDRSLSWLPLAATAGGMVGMLVDSLLGAAAQGIYYCERCEKETESRVHSCGESARQIRGWSWLTNDAINLVSSVVGAAVSAGVVVWLAQTSIWW